MCVYMCVQSSTSSSYLNNSFSFNFLAENLEERARNVAKCMGWRIEICGVQLVVGRRPAKGLLIEAQKQYGVVYNRGSLAATVQCDSSHLLER